MIGRFCLYVEVEGASVAETIGRACLTIADEQRWPIRVTGVNYVPDLIGLIPGSGTLGGAAVSAPGPVSSSADDPAKLHGRIHRGGERAVEALETGR